MNYEQLFGITLGLLFAAIIFAGMWIAFLKSDAAIDKRYNEIRLDEVVGDRREATDRHKRAIVDLEAVRRQCQFWKDEAARHGCPIAEVSPDF